MSLDPMLLRQLHETFRAELDDQQRVVTDALLALEVSVGGPQEREEHLNSAFRAAHNLKGAARSVDLRDISEIAHHLESLFSVLRTRAGAPSGDTVDACLDALDRMREAMVAHQEERPLPFDMATVLASLDVAGSLSAEPRGERRPTASHGTTDVNATVSIAQPPGERCHEPGPAPPAVTAKPQAVPARASGAAGSDNASRAQHIRVSTDQLARVAALADELQVAKVSLDDRLARFEDLEQGLRELASLWRRSGTQLRGGSDVAFPAEVQRLIESTREHVANAEARAGRLGKALSSSINRIGAVSGALQGDIRLLRLVPVATLLRPLVRTVREIGREQGKPVELRIGGEHVEMDRMVLDGVRDPLLHLLRNAIDHGIESLEERLAAGKPEVGVISIDVDGEAGHVVFRVSDDGRGVSVESVRLAAQRKQVASPGDLDRLSERELLALLFAPGFSTRDVVSDISGRGYGLDVVRSNVAALKGTVELETEVDVGTTFVLRVPVTLSSERGLQVCAGGESLVIPSVAVERIVDIAAACVTQAQAEAVYVVDGKAVALRNLAQLLALDASGHEGRERLCVVIVSRGSIRFGLVVDEVLGECEIVVKRLRPPLDTVRNVVGATLTADGSVMIVLDTEQLVDAALRGAHLSRGEVIATDERAPTRILVVDDSITTRTLERSILSGHGYDVTVAIDGREAWEAVQRMSFDLVITDIEMPRMNGFELTARIKGSEGYCELPVIIVSSLARDDEVKQGMEVGADAYITKGQFETGDLLDTVSQLV